MVGDSRGHSECSGCDEFCLGDPCLLPSSRIQTMTLSSGSHLQEDAALILPSVPLAAKWSPGFLRLLGKGLFLLTPMSGTFQKEPVCP